MPVIKKNKNKATMRLERRRMENAARIKAVRAETRRQKRAVATANIQGQSGIIPAINEEAFFEDEDLAYKVASKFCKFVKKLKEIDAREHNPEVRNKIAELKFEIADTLSTKFGKKGVAPISPGKNNAMNVAPTANINALNDGFAKLLKDLEELALK